MFYETIPHTVPYPVPHGLGIDFPHVTCYLDIPGQQIQFIPDIEYQDSDTIVITHSITSLPSVPFAIRISN